MHRRGDLACARGFAQRLERRGWGGAYEPPDRDVVAVETQGDRATVEIPSFGGRRNFARMKRVEGTWRMSVLYLPRPCDAALICT